MSEQWDVEALHRRVLDLEQSKKEQDKRIAQLERETEPMRLERRLSIPEANTLQATFNEVARANTEIGVLKVSVGKIEQRLEQTATKDDVKALEKRLDAIVQVNKLILARLPEKGQERE